MNDYIVISRVNGTRDGGLNRIDCARGHVENL